MNIFGTGGTDQNGVETIDPKKRINAKPSSAWRPLRRAVNIKTGKNEKSISKQHSEVTTSAVVHKTKDIKDSWSEKCVLNTFALSDPS